MNAKLNIMKNLKDHFTEQNMEYSFNSHFWLIYLDCLKNTQIIYPYLSEGDIKISPIITAPSRRSRYLFFFPSSLSYFPDHSLEWSLNMLLLIWGGYYCILFILALMALSFPIGVRITPMPFNFWISAGDFKSHNYYSFSLLPLVAPAAGALCY